MSRLPIRFADERIIRKIRKSATPQFRIAEIRPHLLHQRNRWALLGGGALKFG